MTTSVHPKPDTFVSRHIGPSDADIQAMLTELGYASLDAFIDDTIPETIRFRRTLAIPGDRKSVV